MPAITGAVEGLLDDATLRTLANFVGLQVEDVFIRRGKDDLNVNLPVYNSAAANLDFVVLRDLDTDAPCAPELIRTLLPTPSPRMKLRVAVHEVEAWLLADR